MSGQRGKPTLLDSLRGEGGEGWRMFVAVALCALAVVLIAGLTALIRIWTG
ncbi:MAG TPA: hypothetical protein VE127_00180 [Solirubrobacteraceae bacterium]|nr:hypothetical protein [Solirubrobacteraceae bacterium]